MKNRCFGYRYGIYHLTIIASVFFFLVLSNTVGQTIKKVNLEWGIIFEAQQGCMPCGVGSFESIIDRIDIFYFAERDGYEGSPDITYAL